MPSTPTPGRSSARSPPSRLATRSACRSRQGASGEVRTEPYAGSDDRLLLTERMHVLDERERQIVYLRFHADMTERQIAREVGISQAHVSRLLAAALTKLRAELAEEETPVEDG